MSGKVFGLGLMLTAVLIFTAYTAFILTILPEVFNEIKRHFDTALVPDGYPWLAILLPGLALILGLMFITWYIDSTYAKIAAERRRKAELAAKETGKKK